MRRTHGLVTLAILHHVTIAAAIIGLLGHCLNPGADMTLARVLQLCAFGFLTVFVRRGWASIDGGADGMSPGKAQGLLWVPFYNFYWVFPAFVSLATQTNAKADKEDIPQGRITRGFGLVIAILFSVTTLTSLIPAVAWVDFVLYATYVGFTVTYVWQIRRSAAAFDERSAPATREPSKMPSVGVAGIIYGCAFAALLSLTLTENLFMSPEVIEQRIKAKGYAVSTVDVRIDLSDLEKMKGVVSLDDMKCIQVSRAGQSVGQVFYATILTHNAAELVAKRYNTKTLKAGNKVLFHATRNGNPQKDNVAIEEWLASF